MERWAANTLRILAIVTTALIVIAVCGVMLYLSFFVVMMGALTQHSRILHPQGANFVFGSILTTIMLVTAGIAIIVKLVKGILPARSTTLLAAAGPTTLPAAAAPPRLPSSEPRSLHLPLWPVRPKTTVDRIVLALVARIAISAVTLFQLATHAFVPHNRTLMLLLLFILSEAPYAILIYILLKWPGRRAFAFLSAMLVIPILETLFNPVLLNSYNQIYRNHAMGPVWLALSGLVYIVTLVLVYVAIQRTKLWPKLSSVILATTAMFFYFFFIKAIALYSVWK